jgi:hypothetical protein
MIVNADVVQFNNKSKLGTSVKKQTEKCAGVQVLTAV